MYIAELKGKIPQEFEFKEDILTSNVFSFFKYTARDIFFRGFLNFLEIKADAADLEKAEFIFWPTFEDGTEPDLVILVADNYLLFEAKYTSGFGQETDLLRHQLEREYIQGRQQASVMGLNFHFFTITNDLFENEAKYPDIPRYLWQEVRFINWQNITYLIESVLNSGQKLENRERLMAVDLHELLVRKCLRTFEGTRLLEDLDPVSLPAKILFYDVSSSRYYDEFLGFEKSLASLPGVDLPSSNIFLEI